MINDELKLVELETFFPEIVPEAPRCPTPVIENRIRETIIDACERSNIWRWYHPEILTIKGQVEYDLLTPTPDTLIHSVIDVLPRTGALVHSHTTHEDSYHGHNARGFYVPERGHLVLSNTPTQDASPLTIVVDGVEVDNPHRPNKGITPFVSIKPSRTTLFVTDVLVRDYYNLIVTGTLSKTFMMNNRPWSDAAMAKELEMKYELALAKARQAIDRGFTTSSQQLKSRKFSA